MGAENVLDAPKVIDEGEEPEIESQDDRRRAAELPLTVVQPTRGWAALGLRDVWEYRELLYFLLWREIKGRYRQMAFGPLWVVLSPLINMALFSTLFGQLANLPSEDVPYPLFTYVALLVWQFFANATRKSAESLLTQRQIIAKVYFPRLVIPLSAVLSSLVDFAASFAVLAVMLIIYRVAISWRWLALPLLMLLAAATALGVGLWLAGLAVKFHDVVLALSFLTDVWKYVTPVVYSLALIPPEWRPFYWLNPMTVVIQGVRWSLLGTSPPPTWVWIVAVATVVPLLITGLFYFRRSERTIVDII